MSFSSKAHYGDAASIRQEVIDMSKENLKSPCSMIDGLQRKDQEPPETEESGSFELTFTIRKTHSRPVRQELVSNKFFQGLDTFRRIIRGKRSGGPHV